MRFLRRRRIRIRIYLSLVILIAFLIITHQIIRKNIEEAENNQILEESEVDEQSKVINKYSTSPDAEMEADKINFTGKTKDGSKYDILAETANKKDTGIVELNSITAILDTKEGSIDMLSQTGKFDENKDELFLKNNVHGAFKGYKFFTDTLYIQLKSKNLLAPNPVVIEDDDVFISSDKLESQGEDVLRFEGNVKTYFYNIQ